MPADDGNGVDPHVVGAYLSGDVTLREAVGIEEQDLHDLRTLGHGYLEYGRYDEARVVLEGLVEVDERSAWAHAALGSAYQHLERPEDALSEYEVALEIEPADVTALVNRGEIRLAGGSVSEGVEDLAAAVDQDPDGSDPHANRARALLLATRHLLAAAID